MSHMLFPFLMLLLLVPSFALIMLVASATGFYFLDPPSGVEATGLVYPYFGSAVACIIMLYAGWACAARGGMRWTRLSAPVLAIGWLLVMLAMMKVGLHSFDLWAEQAVAASPFDLLMGGIVAPLSCQGLLLICTFINEDHLQPGDGWYMKAVVSLAAAMAIGLAIGATTLLIETPRRPVQNELGLTWPDKAGYEAPVGLAELQHFAL
jgi:hypothetical protein